MILFFTIKFPLLVNGKRGGNIILGASLGKIFRQPSHTNGNVFWVRKHHLEHTQTHVNEQVMS